MTPNIDADLGAEQDRQEKRDAAYALAEEEAKVRQEQAEQAAEEQEQPESGKAGRSKS